jgi:hypothetical protein
MVRSSHKTSWHLMSRGRMGRTDLVTAGSFLQCLSRIGSEMTVGSSKYLARKK